MGVELPGIKARGELSKKTADGIAVGCVGRVSCHGRSENVHDCDGIVVEDCRDVFRRELVRGIANEQAGLAYSTVSDDNASIKQLKG